MQSILIRDTTRAQREQIVRQGLAACGSSCEGCNGCDNLGGGRVVFGITDKRPRKVVGSQAFEQPERTRTSTIPT